jgi:hypothetical protein
MKEVISIKLHMNTALIVWTAKPAPFKQTWRKASYDVRNFWCFRNHRREKENRKKEKI